MKNRFLISVIIPVYNVGKYLEECLDSISSQSLGMENIQVILVNDGSVDTSEEICLRFKNSYPNNVLYIYQDNSGVSASRNRGIPLASGELTTFLDGDDKWSSDSFEAVYKAYIAHPDICVFSCRMDFFDAESGPHQLNYKYSRDRLVNIVEEYAYPQLSSSSVFIATDTLKAYRYKEGLKYSEDCRFINEILLDCGSYMLLKQPVYMYRRRFSGESTMQQSLKDADYYIPTCENVYRHLFRLSVEKYGSVLRYLQFCIMYDLRWRLKVPLSETGMSTSDQEWYCTIIKELLKEIDDDIILEQKRMALALKLYALELKNGDSVDSCISADCNGIIRYKDTPVFDLQRQVIVRLKSAGISDSSINVKGSVTIPFSESRFQIYYNVNGVRFELPLKETSENCKSYLYGTLRADYDYSISVPVNANETCIFFEVAFDSVPFVAKPKYTTGTFLDRKYGSIFSGDSRLHRRTRHLIISRHSFYKIFSLFLRLMKK